MDTRNRERSKDRAGGTGGSEDTEAGAARLRDLRAQSDHFDAAGDEAIRQTLSVDSNAYVRSVVQRGGQ